jgi:predicted Zn-dependent protease
MRYLLVPLLIFVAPLSWAEIASAEKKCATQAAAQLVSLQGKLFYDPEGNGLWQPARLNQILCQGSRVQTEPFSRASIVFPSGIVIRLSEGTTITLNTIVPGKKTMLDLVKGFVHFISRTPRHLQINTPIANAGPEGTEFAMSVDGNKASLWVYEGGVRFFNAKGSVQLQPGQGAQTLKGQTPVAKIDIKPQDAVNWALYYPPLLPYPDADTKIDPELNAAIQEYRQGRVDTALPRLDALPVEKQTPYFHKVRGAIRLTAGRADLAQQDIYVLRAKNPNDAEALALQSVLALTQNRKDEAYNLASRAAASNSNSATAYSALSYAEQGRFQLDKAQAAADQAANLAPHDAMVLARKAELELSQGLGSESKQTAQQALALDADLERTQTVTGFSHLLQMDTDNALKSFTKAVELDSTSPLARLGLGLAKIREGDLEEGRQDLEIAAILDPNNSIVRSYLGKAYYEERRPGMADEQFKLAKDRDPKDPTPYFYDAINKQTTNRPVEALRDMQEAIELNDNRSVYRSKLQLDSDVAARTANLSRIYNDLGLGRVALKQAWNALGYDSTNPTAHRFLSDAYIGQPRYRVARASELLQAQLLQPINITPVQPQLTGENIGILNSTGPGSLSVNEYDPLYNSNGAHVVLNGAYGSNNTKTDNAIVSGVYNNFSGSLGQFHYQTDGFRQNDDYQQNVYDTFAQYAFTPDLNLQIELKNENVRAGDLPMRLNSSHRENLRQIYQQSTARAGGHYKINSEQDFLFSYFYTSRNDSFKNTVRNDSDPDPAYKYTNSINDINKNKGHQVEIQYLLHKDNFEIIAGFGYLKLNSNEIYQEDENYDDRTYYTKKIKKRYQTDFFNSYVYLKNYLTPNLTTLIGVSFDSLSKNLEYFNHDLYVSYDVSQNEHITTTKLFNKKQLNPKFGLIWIPIDNLTFRAAIFKTLNRHLVTNQTIEPTQIAGFNQFFDSNNDTSAWRYAFGLDYNPVKSIFMGGEISWRDAKQPFLSDDKFILQKQNESSHLAYLYWIPANWLSFRAEYHYEKASRDFTKDERNDSLPQSVTTHQIPISINFFYPNGIFAKISGTYVNQHVGSVNSSQDGQNICNKKQTVCEQKEDFWTFDTVLGYRFPKKIGTISLEVKNLFNHRFKFQSNFDSSGPQLSPFTPERQLFIKLNLFY